MSGPYYYFVAGLPILDFEKPAPFSYESFLEDSQRLISEKDFETLTKAVLSWDEMPSFHPALQKLAQFNCQLQNEIVRVRAKKLEKDPLDYIRKDQSADQQCVQVVHQAAQTENLLEAEKILDRYRWSRFDEISQNHFFDLEVIISYGLKLQILKRHKNFASDKGWEMFKGYQELETFTELLANF